MLGSPLGITRTAGIAWDIWRAGRASQDEIDRRQRDRLAALVECARSSSPFYRRLYRDVPDTVPDSATDRVHDRTSQLVASLLGPIRERRTLMAAKEARAFLHRGLRAAALIADGNHFAGVVLTESARRRSPRIARRVRVFSVLRPLPDLVADLNDFQPTVLYGYPSAMVQLAAEQRAGRLGIHPLLAVASGESLAAHAAAEIEAALGCRVTE